MGKREELRRRRQQARQRQLLAVVAVVVLVAVSAAGFLIYQNTRPIGDIVTIQKEAYPLVDGSSLGPAEARVVIQEFSDFQ